MYKSPGGKTFCLSGMGLGWPELAVSLAKRLERLGYARYWTTEHHSPHQSASPVVEMAATAAATARIGVGAAGVMLRYTHPLRLAKDVHLLERMYGGRISLGTIGGVAGPTDGRLHRLLSLCPPEGPWPSKYYSDLVRYVREPERPLDDGSSPNFCYNNKSTPRLWLCSNSHASAALAAREGVGLIFHLPLAGSDGIQLAREVVEAYRSAFVPNNWLDRALVGVVCSGVCANTESDAMKVWTRCVSHPNSPGGSRESRSLKLPPATFFVGDPSSCREKIASFSHTIGADEVIIQPVAHNVHAQTHTFTLISEAFALAH